MITICGFIHRRVLIGFLPGDDASHTNAQLNHDEVFQDREAGLQNKVIDCINAQRYLWILLALASPAAYVGTCIRVTNLQSLATVSDVGIERESWHTPSASGTRTYD